MGANLVVASKSDTMQACMSKMVARDIRHLPVVDEDTGTVSTHTRLTPIDPLIFLLMKFY